VGGEEDEERLLGQDAYLATRVNLYNEAKVSSDGQD